MRMHKLIRYAGLTMLLGLVAMLLACVTMPAPASTLTPEIDAAAAQSLEQTPVAQSTPGQIGSTPTRIPATPTPPPQAAPPGVPGVTLALVGVAVLLIALLVLAVLAIRNHSTG